MSYPPQRFYPTPPPKHSSAPAIIIVLIIAALGAIALMVAACVIGSTLAVSAAKNGTDVMVWSDTKQKGRQIAYAIHSYHDLYRRLPPANITAENGTPLRSWRVEVCVFMEMDHVYDEVHRDKTWNSGENSFLATADITPFKSARSNRYGDDTTSFVAVVGENTMWPPDGEKIMLKKIDDGNSITIMLIEYPRSNISWHKPQDVTVDTAIAIIKNADTYRGTVVVMADGTPKTIPNSVDEQTLRALFTISGGEQIDTNGVFSDDDPMQN